MIAFKKRPSGFTVVELLIVIVVIGVLATIALLVYREVQRNARNTQRIATAKEYYNAISAYMTLHQEYPDGRSFPLPGFSGNGYCLGVSENYPEWIPGDHNCHTQYAPFSQNIDLQNNLQTTVRSLGEYNKETIKINGNEYLGLIYIPVDAPDYKDEVGVILRYYLEGEDRACGLTNISSGGVSGWPATVVGGKNSGAITDGQGTLCEVLLPDPHHQ